jgi:hypothetical protein
MVQNEKGFIRPGKIRPGVGGENITNYKEGKSNDFSRCQTWRGPVDVKNSNFCKRSRFSSYK